MLFRDRKCPLEPCLHGAQRRNSGCDPIVSVPLPQLPMNVLRYREFGDTTR